jgi:hypothetical protein
MKMLTWCGGLMLLLAACGKSDDDSSGSSDDGSRSSSTGGSAGDQPWDDTSKPYLSEKRMGGFIESLKDSNGPFDAISKGKVSAFNAGQRMDEFEAAARKHGFASGAEYIGVWLRINAAQMQAMQADSNQMMVKTHEDSIRRFEEDLKKPDLTPEVRQMYQDQIKSSKAALEALKQPQEGVNAQDVEVYKKHRPAYEEAMKKWSK